MASLAAGDVPIGVLAALVGVLGLPHGAADLAVGERVLASRWGRGWLAAFAAGYIGLAALVVLFWLWLPLAALTLFLAGSILHFGAEDTAPGRGRAANGKLEILLRGAIPVAGPAVFHPERTGALLGTLVPSAQADLVAQAVHSIAGLAPALAGLGAVGLLAVLRWPPRRPAWGAAATGAQVLTLVAASGLLSPLVFFTAYFCGWHAPRHTWALARRMEPRDPVRGLGILLRAALVPTLATLLLGAVAFGFLATPGRLEEAGLRVLFVGLAALTAPHMLLGACYRPRAT